MTSETAARGDWKSWIVSSLATFRKYLYGEEQVEAPAVAAEFVGRSAIVQHLKQLMTNNLRRFWVFVASGVATAAAFYFYQQNNDIEPAPPKPSNVYEEKIGELMIQNRLLDLKNRMQKDEEEHQRQFELKLTSRRQRREQQMDIFKEFDRENELKRLRSEHESDMRLAKLREDSKLAQLFKNQMSQYETKQLKRRGDLELEHIEKGREEAKRRFEEQIDKDHEQMQRIREDFNRREAEQESEIRKEEERHQARIHEIREQLLRKLEEIRQRDEHRKREMDSILREIQRILQQKLWNEVIENNWTRRLNQLRSANSDVQKAWNQMKRHLNENEQALKLYREQVIAEVTSEKELMRNEAEEMETMYRKTGKEFLIYIRDAVQDVEHKCDRAISALKGEMIEIRSMDSYFSDLQRTVHAIPTLAEIKKNYRESINKEG
ncbi:unnamed protein product [Caenorhabditis sp. 36 PRJEB53466]|nr:unnamed protein product [Caenorhabditis sp. 36 PRJEB53466]